ncbi:MAG: hypothetical protein JNJ45_09640 [Chthonomonas sp.]|nr:hypothetical protein [Chthonomonas sp.]
MLCAFSSFLLFGDYSDDGRLHRVSPSVDGYFIAAEESSRIGAERIQVYLAKEIGESRRVLLPLIRREQVAGRDGLLLNDKFIVTYFTASTADVQFARVLHRDSKLSTWNPAKDVTAFASPGRICQVDHVIYGMIDSPMHGFNNCMFMCNGDTIIVRPLPEKVALMGSKRGSLIFTDYVTQKTFCIRASQLAVHKGVWKIR